MRCACAVLKVGYFVPIFPDGQGDTVCVCVCVCVWYRGTAERGLTGQGGMRDFLGYRPWHDPVFLLAGVDTTSGPPHPLVPSDRVPAVLQKGA